MLPLLLACARPLADVTPGEEPVNVAWVTVDPPDAVVEWGIDETYGHTATPVDGEAELLGLLADTRYHVRAVADGRVGDDVTFRTGALPEELPALEIEGEDDPEAPLTLYTVSVDDDEISATYVLDPQANVVWYTISDGFVIGAHPTRDGTGVAIQISRAPPMFEEEASTLEVIPWDGRDRLVLDHPLGHHDFVELPEGSFAGIISQAGELDGREVVGDAVELLDRDGTRSVLWSAFGTVPLKKNNGWGLDPADWTHANGIHYDDELDLFAISLFRQQQILFFDRAGEIDGVLGRTGDWTIVDDPGFGPQHGPRFTEEGLSLFDNAGTSVSRWVSYRLADGEASPIAEVEEPWGEQSLVCGDGLQREDGSVVTVWGDLGYLLTTSPEGEVLRIVRTRPTGLGGRVDTIAGFP